MTDYRIVYDDPMAPDEPTKVVVPTPEWMEQAMSGMLPPISVFWKLADDEARAIAAGRHKGFEHDEYAWKQQFDAPRIGPLTEREAMEYILMKDVPRHVWGRQYNRPMFAIVHKSQVPSNREFRNAWRLAL